MALPRRALRIAVLAALLVTLPVCGCRRAEGTPGGPEGSAGHAAIAASSAEVTPAHAVPPSGDPSRGPTTPAAAFPVVVRDNLGRDVTIAAEPRRIVTLLPSHTETMFALGLGDRVVGVDDFSDAPASVAKLPRLGGLYDARIEQIVALAPDLVLASEWGNAAERLSVFGIHVWAGSASKFDDVYRVIDALGHLTGRDDAAAALEKRIRAEVEAVEAPLRGLPRVRVYYELDATPYTVGPGSFIGVMLTKAGGENIIPASQGDFPRISPELVITRDPEVILGVTLEEASRRPGWSAITAVRRGRVAVLPSAERDLVVRAGPRLGEGLRVLAHRLHPEVVP